MSILRTREDFEDRYNYTALDNPKYEILTGWRGLIVARFIEKNRNKIWNNSSSKIELLLMMGIYSPKVEWLSDDELSIK